MYGCCRHACKKKMRARCIRSGTVDGVLVFVFDCRCTEPGCTVVVVTLVRENENTLYTAWYCRALIAYLIVAADSDACRNPPGCASHAVAHPSRLATSRHGNGVPTACGRPAIKLHVNKVHDWVSCLQPQLWLRWGLPKLVNCQVRRWLPRPATGKSMHPSHARPL